MKNITYEEFSKVELRCATIIKVEEFAEAKKPAFKIWADFGSEIGVLQTSAQVTVNYTPTTLLGKKIIGCINLGAKNIAGFLSQFLLLGFSDKNEDIYLATTDLNVPNGKKMH